MVFSVNASAIIQANDETVFKLMQSPASAATWLCPKDHEIEIRDYDLRTDGRFAMSYRNLLTRQIFESVGHFPEVRACKVVRIREHYNHPRMTDELEAQIALTSLGDATKVEVTQGPFPDTIPEFSVFQRWKYALAQLSALAEGRIQAIRTGFSAA